MLLLHDSVREIDTRIITKIGSMFLVKFEALVQALWSAQLQYHAESLEALYAY